MDYELREEPPDVDTFVRLREAADMARRSREGVERGLPNSRYAVRVVAEGGAGDPAGDPMADPDWDSDVVGMARVIGDGGSVYHISDMVVHPDHQRRGLGTLMMDAIMDWLHETAPPRAYVNLMADVDGFYERWGFEPTAPASKGMYYRIPEDQS